MEDGVVVNRVARWSTEEGVNYSAYFAMVNGEAKCVRLEIGALTNTDGTMPKVGECLREPPELLRGLRSEDLARFGLNSMLGRSHGDWVALLEDAAGSPDSSEAMKEEAIRMLPIAKDAQRASTPGPSSMRRQEAEELAELYRSARDEGKDPAQVIANANKVSERTARRWIKRLRDEFELLD